jgi:hypothetical protein
MRDMLAPLGVTRIQVDPGVIAAGRPVSVSAWEPALSFLAQDVYLVLGGTGSLDVSVDGRHTQTIHIGGVSGSTPCSMLARRRTIVLHATPGVQAYDFTFGWSRRISAG